MSKRSMGRKRPVKITPRKTVYKIRRKSDGLFWRLVKNPGYDRSVYPAKELPDVIFVEEDKAQEFPSTGAARNAFAQKTEMWAHTHNPSEPYRDPDDFELIEYEALLTRMGTLPLKPKRSAAEEASRVPARGSLGHD
jgi:hypothetical protein